MVDEFMLMAGAQMGGWALQGFLDDAEPGIQVHPLLQADTPRTGRRYR